MDVIIVSSSVLFKNPHVGQPSRAIEDHYYGRRISAFVDGKRRMFRFDSTELSFEADEEEMEVAIVLRLKEEKDNFGEEEE